VNREVGFAGGKKVNRSVELVVVVVAAAAAEYR